MVKYLCLAVVFMITVISEGGPHAAWGGTSKPTAAEKLNKSQKSLEKLNRQLQQMQKKQEEAVKRERSILKQVERSDQHLQMKRRELGAIEEKIRERDSEIETLRQQHDSLQEMLVTQRAWVGDRLVTIYKEGKTPYIKVLIASQDYHDFLKRYTYFRRVTQKEADLMTNYENGVKALEGKSARLEEMKSVLLDDRNELQGKLKEFGAEKRKKDMLLARIRNEKVTYDQAIQELEESSQKLQTLIKGLEKKRRQVRLPKNKADEQPGTRGISLSRGQLNWPVNGTLVSRFGLQKHPKFDTYIYRKGIEIGSFQGSTIRSVYQGQVAFADWFPGYGMVIILDHGDNYYSLYAHLAKLLVSVGGSVKKEQVIGEIGDTGVSEGDRLYFELRRGEQPVDPLTWLKAKP
jgi:septal ring factor EnvC (AmiA/AmiB activator)